MGIVFNENRRNEKKHIRVWSFLLHPPSTSNFFKKIYNFKKSFTTQELIFCRIKRFSKKIIQKGFFLINMQCFFNFKLEFRVGFIRYFKGNNVISR